MSDDGLVQVDRTVDSIRVGRRHRRDLGDIDALARSIADLGLLQPITITPDGTLVCGARRLEAVKRLGLRTIGVWVRPGISTDLQRMLAEQHENTERKPLSPTEAAVLYRELKALLAEDAARRQHATRFASRHTPGGADSAPPAGRAGRTRAQAAQMVTGRNSYSMLEQVSELQRLAADPGTDESLQALAAEALAGIDRDGKVHGHYQRVRAATAAPGGLPADAPEGRRRAGSPVPPARAAVRRFVLGLSDLKGWLEPHDPTVIGPALDDAQWADLEHLAAATAAFVDRARHARAAERA